MRSNADRLRDAEEIARHYGIKLIRIPYESAHDSMDYIVPPYWHPGDPQWLVVGRDGDFTVVMP